MSASDHAYQYSRIDVQYVARNIDEYIIPENQEACKLLWDKNIFTVMCNNYENDFSWITINTLSNENQRIFDDLLEHDVRVGKTWGGYGFKVPVKPGKGIDTFEDFRKVIDLFEYQDVQKDGYMTVEEFFTYYTDCYDAVNNPEFKGIIEPKSKDYENPIDYINAYDKYLESFNVPRIIRVFNPSKVTKSVEEYLENTKYKDFYDKEMGRIYYSEFYYDAHMKYKKNMNKKTPIV